MECGVRLVSALELFSFNIPHSTFNDEISSERYFVERERLRLGERSLFSDDRRLRRIIPRLGIFLRSLQIFLRSLLLTEKRLLFWVRQVHWVHGIFVSPIV